MLLRVPNLAAQPDAERHGGVVVAAGNMACRRNHEPDGQSVRQRDGDERTAVIEALRLRRHDRAGTDEGQGEGAEELDE